MMFVVAKREKERRETTSGRVQPLLLLSCDGGGLLFISSPQGDLLGKRFFLCLSASRVSRGTTIE